MIRFECPHCGQAIKAKDGMAGKLSQCPVCGGHFQIPEAIPDWFGEVLQEPAAPPPPPEQQPPEPKTKSCPFCAEQILKDAVKCRFCGEFLDERTRPQTRPRQAPSEQKIVERSGEGLFLQTLNAGCFGIFVWVASIGLMALFGGC
jgi:hypothetical protein